jgi:hypothetical protein
LSEHEIAVYHQSLDWIAGMRTASRTLAAAPKPVIKKDEVWLLSPAVAADLVHRF